MPTNITFSDALTGLITDLPTSDPSIAGALWKNGDELRISGAPSNGSGGSGINDYSQLIPTDIPVHTDYTAVNQGTATISSSPAGVMIINDRDGEHHIWEQATPVAPFTYYAKMQSYFDENTSGTVSTSQAAITLRNSVTGAFVAFTIGFRKGSSSIAPCLQTQRWTNATTFSSEPFTAFLTDTNPEWTKVDVTSTTITWSVNIGGFWIPVTTETIATHIGTVNRVGFSFRTDASTENHRGVVNHFGPTVPSVMITGGEAVAVQPKGVTLTRAAASPSMASNATYVVSWTDQVVEDVTSYWDISAPTNIVIPEDGWYDLNFGGQDTEGLTARHIFARIKVNGVTVQLTKSYIAGSHGGAFPNVSHVEKLSAGAVVTFEMSCAGATTTFSNLRCSVLKVAGATILSADAVAGSRVLIEEWVSAGSSTKTFSSISQDYESIELEFVGSNTIAATSGYVYVTANGDSGTNYNLVRIGTNAASAVAEPGFGTNVNGATAPTDSISEFNFQFPNYNSTTQHKICKGIATRQTLTTNGGQLIDVYGQRWRNVAAITSLAVTAVGGNLASGSKLRLYGVLKTPTLVRPLSGTSFPTSPSIDDVFYRTDRRIEYFWDGARWLSTQLFHVPIAMQSTLSAFTISPIYTDFPIPPTDNGFYVTKFVVNVYSNVTPSANYYSCQLYTSIEGSGLVNNHGTPIVLNTAVLNQNNRFVRDINVVIPANQASIGVVATETGSANQVVSFMIEYRLVG